MHTHDARNVSRAHTAATGGIIRIVFVLRRLPGFVRVMEMLGRGLGSACVCGVRSAISTVKIPPPARFRAHGRAVCASCAGRMVRIRTTAEFALFFEAGVRMSASRSVECMGEDTRFWRWQYLIQFVQL